MFKHVEKTGEYYFLLLSWNITKTAALDELISVKAKTKDMIGAVEIKDVLYVINESFLLRVDHSC